jgi:hypothetical protein
VPCSTEAARKNRSTPLGRAKFNARNRAYRQKYYYKFQARRKVTQAVARGKLIKPLECENCHQKKLLDGHHNDYSKPFDVHWYCRACHLYFHAHGKMKVV